MNFNFFKKKFGINVVLENKTTLMAIATAIDLIIRLQ